MAKIITADTIKTKVKEYVLNELKNAKHAHDLNISVINCRAIAFGALQFAINILPDSDFEELNKWWQDEIYDKFNELIMG